MRFLSICSGIESASVAWEPLGWTPLAFSEIAPFPAAVLRHRWPHIPNLGDLTLHHEWPARLVSQPDVLIGGTPCQSFSVAGLRRGLADPRGNLALVFLALVAARQPRWIVWENVAGVLAANGGRDFGTLLGALAQLGYGWAYRILDAQFFGVPQRRRRIFLIGHTGGARDRAAAVLFEPESLRRDTAAGGPPPPDPAGLFAQSPASHHHSSLKVVHTIDASYGRLQGCSGQDARRGHPHLIPCWWDGSQRAETIGTVLSKFQTMPDKGRFPAVLEPIAFHGSQDPDVSGPVTHPVGRNQGQETCVLLPGLRVRRLTPRECERLQGFPDDHTLVPYPRKLAADSPRYKAIGNSIAVPVLRWLARRMLAVEQHFTA